MLVRDETETSCDDAPLRARPALDFTGAHYEPRRPEGTVLHDLVRGHIGAFLNHARDIYERPLPRYVKRRLHEYMRCDVLAHCFLHFHRDDCGGDLLVAFSGKNRGLCPNCGQRRMCNTAAHLRDRVLLSVPVRQWVLSLPDAILVATTRRLDRRDSCGGRVPDIGPGSGQRPCSLPPSIVGPLTFGKPVPTALSFARAHPGTYRQPAKPAGRGGH